MLICLKYSSTLVSNPHIKLQQECRIFVEHILEVYQKQYFELLMAGFCHKFLILDKESFKSDKKYKKVIASLMNKISVKLSSKQDNTGTYYSKTENCFRIQRSLVRMLLRVSSWICLLDNSWTCISQKKQIATLVWVKVVNKRVYFVLAKETDCTLYQYWGAALHQMIHLKKDTLATVVKMDAQL